MKRFYLSVSFVATILISNTSEAQLRAGDVRAQSGDFSEWGIKAGSDFQLLSSFPFSQSLSTGVLAGAYASSHGETYGIRCEVTISSAHYTTEFAASHAFELTKTVPSDTVTKGDLNAYYIHIPILWEIRPVKHVCMLLGGEYSYLATVTDNNGALSKTVDTKTVFKTGNISAVMGLEVDISKSFRIGATYALGFSDVNNQKFQSVSDRWTLFSGNAYLTYQIRKYYHVQKGVRKH